MSLNIYRFRRLIDKYSVPFQLVKEGKGAFVGGKYEKGAPVVLDMMGAITEIRESKIYQSGGYLTTQDRVLYLPEPLEDPLEGLKVVHRGNEYKVESLADYSEYGDVATYTLKWVSSFDGGADHD